MKKHIVYILFCIFFISYAVSYAHAETIVLRTGARVKGEIVFQNDEVVIVREVESGARFQYPKADVAEIIEDDRLAISDDRLAEDEPEIKTSKKASILLEVAGGAAVIPNEKTGGMASADLLVGSHHIGDKHLFIGGGLGYHGVFFGGERYNFLPIQVALRMPFTERKHAPVFGLALGYGVALSKDYLGGVYTGVDLGYRCQLNPKTAIGLVLFTQFQQAKVESETVIEGDAFVSDMHRNIVTCGAKIAIYL